MKYEIKFTRINLARVRFIVKLTSLHDLEIITKLGTNVDKQEALSSLYSCAARLFVLLLTV